MEHQTDIVNKRINCTLMALYYHWFEFMSNTFLTLYNYLFIYDLWHKKTAGHLPAALD